MSPQGQYSVGNNGLRSPNPTGNYGPNPEPGVPSSYTAIGVDHVLANLVGPRLARAENVSFSTGSGAGTMLGCTTAPVGATSGSATALAYSDLQNLWASLDPAYQINATWMVSPAVYKAIRALEDSTGRPLFPPDQALAVFGRPVVQNRNMAGLTHSAISAVCGDFSRGYVIRVVQKPIVTVLNERYGDQLQRAVIASERVDGTLDDPNALRTLQQA